MLVVLFWIFTFVAVASIIAFIIGLFFKNMMFRKIVVIAFIISLLGLIITFKSCINKVKDDFGYQPKSEKEIELIQLEQKQGLEKAKKDIQSAQHIFDSIKQKQSKN